MVDIGVEEVDHRTCLVEDLPELVDSLASLVGHIDEVAFRTQGSGCRNNRREEEGACLRTAHLRRSRVLVVGFHREHSLAQAAVVTVEEGLGHVVRTVREEEAVRNLGEVADFCWRYRQVLVAGQHSSV